MSKNLTPAEVIRELEVGRTVTVNSSRRALITAMCLIFLLGLLLMWLASMMLISSFASDAH